MVKLNSLLSLLLVLTASTSIEAQDLALEATGVYNTRCAGSSTGMVLLEPTGGSTPYQINTNLNLSALPAGEYQFMVTDFAGATATVNVSIADHPAVCGCVYPSAINYSALAEVDNGNCVFASDPSCLADIVPDGVVGTNDLLQLLTEFGQICN
jgi:hypothetical protein